jgi:hypothetical protein
MSSEQIDQALGGGRKELPMSTPTGEPAYEWYGRAAQYGTLPNAQQAELDDFAQREAIKAQYKTDTGGGSTVDDYILRLEQELAGQQPTQ